MHERLQTLTSRQIIKILTENKFALVRTKGSHKQFSGIVGGQKRRVTVVSNQKRFNPKTLASMLRQSGLTEEQWLNSL